MDIGSGAQSTARDLLAKSRKLIVNNVRLKTNPAESGVKEDAKD
jgi:hypothetical protein